jgi:hypothetical protein
MLMHVLLYVQHTTVQCEASGVAELLAIFPKIFLHSAEQILLCLTVCLCLTAFPDTYIFL